MPCLTILPIAYYICFIYEKIELLSMIVFMPDLIYIRNYASKITFLEDDEVELPYYRKYSKTFYYPRFSCKFSNSRNLYLLLIL